MTAVSPLMQVRSHGSPPVNVCHWVQGPYGRNNRRARRRFPYSSCAGSPFCGVKKWEASARRPESWVSRNPIAPGRTFSRSRAGTLRFLEGPTNDKTVRKRIANERRKSTRSQEGGSQVSFTLWGDGDRSGSAWRQMSSTYMFEARGSRGFSGRYAGVCLVFRSPPRLAPSDFLIGIEVGDAARRRKGILKGQ
jgi:hypothetical protein